MMMIKSLQHLFLAISSLLLLLSANALVPNDCLSCRGSNTAAAAATAFRARSPFTSLPSWKQPQTRSLSKHSSLVVLLSATAVDDSLVESKQKTQPPSLPPNDDNDGELDLSSRIINFVFLALAFGYAAYTILNIDNGMTRGWTTGEIAMRIPLDNWGAYEDYLANKPIFTKTLINVIIYLLGDWLSQTAFQGKNVLDFDISRTLRNGFIGLCFGPLVHEYYQFSDTILPPENGFVTRLEKIFMDQTIYLTVKCSIYISAVGLLGGDDLATVKQTVQDKIGGVVVTAWKFWPLVHCITYGLIPARHRILWVNSVDLVWNAILASKAQKTDEDGSEEGGEGEASSLVLDAVAVEIENDEQEPAQAHNSLKGAGDEVPSLILENNNKLSLVEEESSSEHNTVAAEVMELNGTMVSGSNSTEKGVLVAP